MSHLPIDLSDAYERKIQQMQSTIDRLRYLLESARAMADLRAAELFELKAKKTDKEVV